MINSSHERLEAGRLSKHQITVPAMLPLCFQRGVSQIDDDVDGRLRAADEEVAVGRFFEWLRSIGDRSRNQAALTVVADAGPASPADRDVARLGQLQNALVGRLPMRGDAAARE